jgi:hypothetical protein
MSSHLSIRDIERYRSKAITADEVRLLDSHLSECEECLRSFQNSESIDAAYRLVRRSLKSVIQQADTHIAYEEIAAYVDGHLDSAKRDLVEAHLKTCTDCKNDVSEMMGLQEAIASDDQRTVAVMQASAPFWQSTAFRIGVEALAVLLIIVGVIWFSNRGIESLRSENERLRNLVADSEAVIAELKQRTDMTASGPEITLTVRDGQGIVTLDAQGNLRGLELLPEKYRQEVKKVLETGQVSLSPVVAQLRGGPEIRMSGNNDEPGFSLLSPVGIVVETSRPTFQWKKLSDAVEYDVSVYDARGEVVTREKVAGNEWRPATALARGQIYHWQVRAITKDDREVKSPPVGQPDAKFSVLDQDRLNEIERAREAYPGSHLVLGTIYARAGFVNEARREFRALLATNPDSQISHRILRSLKRR